MEQSTIFQPVIIQAGLMVLIAFWLVWARVGSVMRGKVDMRDVVKDGWQGWIKNAGDNYGNQFELPLLFFVLCTVQFLLGSVTQFTLLVAWVFVVSRIIHAGIHLTFNHIFTRFLVFFTGAIALTVLFILTAKAVF